MCHCAWNLACLGDEIIASFRKMFQLSYDRESQMSLPPCSAVLNNWSVSGNEGSSPDEGGPPAGAGWRCWKILRRAVTCVQGGRWRSVVIPITSRGRPSRRGQHSITQACAAQLLADPADASDDRRYGGRIWRPLCTFRHTGSSRAARGAAVWSFWASLEERQTYLGKIQDELAEKHITEEQFKNAYARDLERDRIQAAQMRDMLSNARSEYQAVSQVGSERQRVHQKTNEKLGEIMYAKEEPQFARAADVEHGLLDAKELQDMLSTVRSEHAELGEKTIELPQSQTLEKIVAL